MQFSLGTWFVGQDPACPPALPKKDIFDMTEASCKENAVVLRQKNSILRNGRAAFSTNLFCCSSSHVMPVSAKTVLNGFRTFMSILSGISTICKMKCAAAFAEDVQSKFCSSAPAVSRPGGKRDVQTSLAHIPVNGGAMEKEVRPAGH